MDKKDQRVTCLKDVLLENMRYYGYEEMNDRIPYLITLFLAHIERMETDPDAILCFTENNGARDYVSSKGRDAIFAEIREYVGEFDNDVDLLVEYGIKFASEGYDIEKNTDKLFKK